VTANQIVAYNLFLARIVKGWEQAQACEELAPYLGRRWTVAQLSTAERSVVGKRIRNFSADEIAAFAKAFEQPIAWFFMPPFPEDPLRRLPRIEAPKSASEDELLDVEELAELSTGAGHLLAGRLEPALQGLGPDERARLTQLLVDEARVWQQWLQSHPITREQDSRLREQDERGELPPIPKEDDDG
jgi:hypothetical protein